MAELRMALRRLGRRPGRSGLAVLTLGLGIAASTVSFSAVQGVILDALPIARQDEVVVVWHENTGRDFVHVPFRASAVDVIEAGTTVFATVGAVETVGAQSAIAEGPAGALTVDVARVHADFFGALGAQPAAGRLLAASDADQGAAPVAVVSHSHWAGEWGADPGIVGTRLRLRGTSHVIVGVAGPGLEYPAGTDVWVTYAGADPAWNPIESIAEVDLVARLRPGVTSAEAGRQTNQVLREHPDFGQIYSTVSPVVVPIAERIVGRFSAVLRVGLGSSAIVLLVAIANATLLFLSGGARSIREVAVRRALGAGHWRVVAPITVDAAITGALAVLLGVALAFVTVTVLLPFAPPELPRMDRVSLDWRAVGFAAVAGLLAMAGSGGLAGLWMLRGSPPDALVDGGAREGGPGGEGLRRAIASAQIGFAVVAAFGAGMLVRTVDYLDALDRGFDVGDLQLVRIEHGHDLFGVPAGYVDELRRVSNHLSALPDIVGATPTINGPLDFNSGVEIVPSVEDQTEEEAATNPFVSLDAVLPGYFQLLGTEIREGRAIEAEDVAEAPRAVVINESAARVLWRGQSPLGRRVAIYPGQPEEWATVVGVVEDSRYRSFPEPRPAAWVSLAQYSAIPPARLLVRTRGPGVGVRERVAGALTEHAPYARVLTVDSLEQLLLEPTLMPRFARAVLLTFAGVTLALAGLGVYGVFTLLVQERRRELGVRKALGARGVHLVRFVTARVLKVGGVGAVIGLSAGILLARFLRQLVYGIEPADVRNLLAVLAAALVVALLAGVPPALQAARADAGRALRAE